MLKTKSVVEKMGIKENARTIFVNAPTEAIEFIGRDDFKIDSRLTGMFDYIHLFSTSQADLNNAFPRLKTFLSPSGALWVSWPKSGQLGTDLNIKHVIRIGYDHGLVESKAIGINETWSAIKFTHPRPGKVYQNSYGKLKN